MTSDSPSPVPKIHLLCMQKSCAEAFHTARLSFRLPSSVSLDLHECSLSALPDTVQFDTIVSPANSYGRLDGAFDDAISRALSPRDDYLALTRAAQTELYRRWRGYAPPGTCTLLEIPEEFGARSTRNVWGARRVALCPTMRMPADTEWDREVVYECVWSLLCAVDNHNRAVRAAGGKEDELIRSVLMTPLATGVGRVSPERWASQAVMAIRHFVEASENPEKWSSLGWSEIDRQCNEVRSTWEPVIEI
ncbi:hypothetical protein CSOJ01_13842 [Colletotrichum sojae]|uniref:Macro domain-like protein n=1 Tax=Colletotrichum sojae TaxID=2175907 RepID=A0A8H6MJT7_9PEZI|nr:hypothetical protein CSOJ01_13842 [Colletotrichum sojae]